ncbi:MAG: methylenetetrahydrofolate reductase [Clostridia bacterium]|nr:methylenetetrahydrofolate reductase [Clostridia bacterium]
MSSLAQALESNKFVITAEIGPAKGSDISEVTEMAELLKDQIDAANVTDLQSSVMRLGSLATCHILKEHGLDPIFQLTCRDRNRLAIQSDLLSASVLGIQNVLALTGDYPSLGDHPHAKPVFDLDSVQLLWVIKRLQEGYDLAGNELKGKPIFYPGAVVKPITDSEIQMDLQIIKMEKKADLGAKFFQTQAVFDVPAFEKFMDRVSHINVPIIAGIIMLKSAKMAQYMNANVAGVFVPDPIVERMEKAKTPEDRVKTSIDIAAELIEQLRPLVQGVHIMALGWEQHIPTLLDAIGEKERRRRRRRILVLDADDEFRRKIEKLCTHRYEVSFALNRADGLEKVEELSPDLIVLGVLDRPEESASFCRQVKRDPKYAGIPVLVVDAPPTERRTRSWRRADGMTLEAEDYIARPIPDAALIAHIEELVR